jgi:hypothetical protein
MRYRWAVSGRKEMSRLYGTLDNGATKRVGKPGTWSNGITATVETWHEKVIVRLEDDGSFHVSKANKDGSAEVSLYDGSLNAAPMSREEMREKSYRPGGWQAETYA